MSERDLFIAALQISGPAQRSAWLDRECAGDASLRQRIEALLQALDKAGSLLERPLVAPPGTVGQLDVPAELPPCTAPGHGPLLEAPGTVIGAYKLLQQIGEG